MTPRTLRAWLLPLCAAIAILAAPKSATRADDSELPEADGCLSVTGQALMQAYGYRHVVTVRNQCRRIAYCEVWTTADPTPRHRLEVPIGESRSVTTRLGSPAREVVAQSECQLGR